MSEKNPLLTFVHQMESLKGHPRFTNNPYVERKDTAASHCWRTSLMTLTVGKLVGVTVEDADPPVNILRVSQLAIIHDIVEINSKETKALNFRDERQKREQDKSSNFLDELKYLPSSFYELINGLWAEFLAQETVESRLVTAFGHLESNSTWIENGGPSKDPDPQHVQNAIDYVTSFLGLDPGLDVIINAQAEEIRIAFGVKEKI